MDVSILCDSHYKFFLIFLFAAASLVILAWSQCAQCQTMILLGLKLVLVVHSF
jgi:hypothetical protein